MPTETPQKKEISANIRDLIIRNVVNEGKSNREVARSFNISEKSVRRIVLRYNEGNTINASRRGGPRASGLTPAVIDAISILISDNNNYNLQELKIALGVDVCLSTIWRWLKSLNYTYKITRTIPELRNCQDVKLERVSYISWYLTIPLNMRYRNIIYIDESPFNLHMIRSHGYSLRGVTPNQLVRSSRGNNITMILAINCNNIINSEAIIGTGVNTDIFQGFLSRLVGILGQDEEFTIVMDNVRFHHANQAFYDSYPYAVHYLPRYSPFLNPCEEAFSKIKNSVRRANAPMGGDELVQRMLEGTLAVNQSDLSSYVQHCERFFVKCTNMEDIDRQ